jgi:hypothetical protein
VSLLLDFSNEAFLETFNRLVNVNGKSIRWLWNKKNGLEVRHQRLTPVVLTAPEAEIGRIIV